MGHLLTPNAANTTAFCTKQAKYKSVNVSVLQRTSNTILLILGYEWIHNFIGPKVGNLTGLWCVAISCQVHAWVCVYTELIHDWKTDLSDTFLAGCLSGPTFSTQ